jgi:hypothetical protein
MLDGEDEMITIAAQIEIAISPGVELWGAAQCLAGASVTGTFLGVVDDEDGDAMAPLPLAQIGEQRGNFAAGVRSMRRNCTKGSRISRCGTK